MVSTRARTDEPALAPASSDRADVVAWLLDGDPAVRWQVLRDLTTAPDERVRAERARVAHEGWGARLLDAQDPDGRWAGALYSPKWTSTTYTLLLLHWLGLPRHEPHALAGCRQVWDGARFYDGGLNLAKSIREPETCITGMLVLLASSFGYHDERLADAVAVLVCGRRTDGTWRKHRSHPGREWFALEPPGPSRLATLRCLRVLDWWDQRSDRKSSSIFSAVMPSAAARSGSARQ